MITGAIASLLLPLILLATYGKGMFTCTVTWMQWMRYRAWLSDKGDKQSFSKGTLLFEGLRAEFHWFLEPVIFKATYKKQSLCIQILIQSHITKITLIDCDKHSSSYKDLYRFSEIAAYEINLILMKELNAYLKASLL